MKASVVSISMSSTLIRSLMFAVVGALSLGFISHSTPAEAKWTRTHASDCIAVRPVTNWIAPFDITFGLWNDSTKSPMILLCALSDTDYLPKGALKSVNIHGKDGHPTQNVDAMVCRSNWFTTGGACSPIVSSPTGTPDYTLQPNLTAIQGAANVANFAYIWVRLPPKAKGVRSGLRGFYTVD